MMIKPLSAETLEQTIEMTNLNFPENLQGDELAKLCFRASLDKDEPEYKAFLDKIKVSNPEYWVAIDNNGKVVGVTGLYSYAGGPEDTAWIGWTVVDESQRGRGIGRALFQLVIDKAKSRGNKYLMVYNTDHPIVERANKMYNLMGFTKEVQTDKFKVLEEGKEMEYNLYIWQLDLTK